MDNEILQTVETLREAIKRQEQLEIQVEDIGKEIDELEMEQKTVQTALDEVMDDLQEAEAELLYLAKNPHG